MPIWKFFTSRVYQVTTHVGEKNPSRVRNSLGRSGSRNVGRNVVGVAGRRDFSFHAFSEGTRRVLFRAGRCISRLGIEKFPVQHRRGSSLSKQRTSYFPLNGLTAPLDSSTRFSRMPAYTVPRPDPDRCITHIMLESSHYRYDRR